MASSPHSLTRRALQKFRKNRWGVFSFWFIIFCGIIALLAYPLAPDDSVNANQMHVSINSKKPGFTVQMLIIPHEKQSHRSAFRQFFGGKENNNTEIPIAGYTFREGQLYIQEYRGEGLSGLEKIVPRESFPPGMTVQEISASYIVTKKFLLGTDKYGRDLLSRMLIGARISFSIGFVAVFISLVIGILFGAMAGYYSGKTDILISWLINITWSIPTLLMVIAITLALGKGFWQVFIAVGLTMWVEVARVVRGQVMSVKEMPYITAAKALGFKSGRIIFRHVLPNVMAPVIVIAASNFAAAILVESGLSFLGVGAQPPTPSWGGMIKDHYSYIILGKPYLAIIPGIAIMSLVMAFMLMGNALRDALDVKG